MIYAAKSGIAIKKSLPETTHYLQRFGENFLCRIFQTHHTHYIVAGVPLEAGRCIIEIRVFQKRGERFADTRFLAFPVIDRFYTVDSFFYYKSIALILFRLTIIHFANGCFVNDLFELILTANAEERSSLRV